MKVNAKLEILSWHQAHAARVSSSAATNARVGAQQWDVRAAAKLISLSVSLQEQSASHKQLLAAPA